MKSVLDLKLTVAYKILARKGEKGVSISFLSKASRLSADYLMGILSLKNSVVLDGDRVVVKDVVEFLLESWSDPVSIREVMLAAGWQKIEALCARICEINGYKTLANLRLKTSEGRRAEIDVVAYSCPRLLLIDCKRWKRMAKSKLDAAVENQKMRTAAFVEQIRGVRTVYREVKSWGYAEVYPLLVTVLDDPYRIHGGVPVVPVRLLSQFLSELDAHADELYRLVVRP